MPCIRALACLALVGAVCASCRSRGPATGATAGKTRLDLSFLRSGQTVEARGRFVDGRFKAESLEVEDPDSEVTLKGRVRTFEMGRRGRIGGAAFTIPADARVVDEDGHRLAAVPTGPDTWAKAECVSRAGALRLRKLTLRERKEREREEIEGRIDRIDLDDGSLVIGGIEVFFGKTVPVSWDVEGRAPPPPDERGFGQVPGRHGLRRIVRPDEEDRRPDEQLRTGILTIGGEVQYDAELRDNFDLRNERERDRLVHELSATIEVSADISPRLFGFLQGRVSRRFVGFDQDRDLDFGAVAELGEAYLLIEDVPVAGLALQIGRQDFDHGREWLMDDQLDALRAYYRTEPVTFQASVSTILAGAAEDQEDVVNYLLGAEWEARGGDLFFYALRRTGGDQVRLERTHLGLSAEGELRDTTFWLDLAYVFGDENNDPVQGFGIDMAVLREFKAAPLRPYVFGGFAFGSGDPDLGRGLELGFRQSGLHDNNDRLGGVESYRYLGELVRPELSNLMVFTAGIGFRPTRRLSIDLVYHRYAQDKAAPFLQDTRLRMAPNGRGTGLGDEIDLVVGIKRFSPVEIEIVLGWFLPGPAFDRRDDAWLLRTQVEWNF